MSDGEWIEIINDEVLKIYDVLVLMSSAMQGINNRLKILERSLELQVDDGK